MSYTHPSQFEPLIPQTGLESLYEITQAITATTLSLRGAVNSTTGEALAKLLRSMNSYYSNKIEGHSTHPVNIERGLHKDFSDKPNIAKLQRLAVAHIEAEEEIESWINADKNFSPFSIENILKIHESFYRRLSTADRTIEDQHIIYPGQLRNVDVTVGHHLAPKVDSIKDFLARYEQAYVGISSWDTQLIKIACAHHRLSWIHPFLDGNGRVTRLMSHAALYKDFTAGLWSVCRGLARTSEDYYAQLQNADQPRQGALDGRGNLSEKGLKNFCHYFLNVCLDQVKFMSRMLDFNSMRKRISALLIYQSELDKKIRREAELPLHYLFTSGQLTRSEFKQMTGLGDKVAQILLSQLIKTGLVESDSSLGPVRFGLPLDALRFYFPDLYPEVETKLNDI